jgi:hypothetical protein
VHRAEPFRVHKFERDGKVKIKFEQVRKWEDTVVIYFKMLRLHMSENIEVNYRRSV